MKISTKAQKYYDMFDVGTRDNGEVFAFLKAGHGKKLGDAVNAVHGDIFPNDWIYMKFHDLLGSIADYDIDTIDELEDVRSEIVDGLVDIYTHEQKQWLIDYPKADEFMSEAVAGRVYSTDDGMWQVYSYAQYLAIDDIMNEVINLLSNSK
jgi:hypothetical protein